MKCPHCTTAFHDNWDAFTLPTDYDSDSDWICVTTICPSCDNPVIKIGRRKSSAYNPEADGYDPAGVADERLIYPMSSARGPVGDGVPESLKADYKEACNVLSGSPKASAALSRRVLQAILRDQGYSSRDLARQIDDVLDETDPNKVLPTNLRHNVDVIRKFGNFSAHEVTDKTTLQIIDVEPEEAEWCLEIVERLFDHYYVRPAADAKRLTDLNNRLQQSGQPPTKS